MGNAYRTDSPDLDIPPLPADTFDLPSWPLDADDIRRHRLSTGLDTWDRGYQAGLARNDRALESARIDADISGRWNGLLTGLLAGGSVGFVIGFGLLWGILQHVGVIS